MSNDDFQRVEEAEKTSYFKKLAAPLAVAGVCGAAALLLAGGKTAAPAATEMVEQPFLSEHTDLLFDASKETCGASFNRMWFGNHDNFLGSQNMKRNMVDGKYEDPMFPAANSSLFWDMQTGANAAEQVKTYKGLNAKDDGTVWLRPTEMENAKLNSYGMLNKGDGTFKPSLFGPKGIQVRTSEQSMLGDCWFLSSATAVAETPGRIHEIFGNTMEYNDDGAFQMYFYVRGEKVAVHIDDRIPYTDFGPGYVYRYQFINNKMSQDGAWWLVLLEKAMAKLNVNYSNLNSGYACQGLRALTGAPCVSYQQKDLTEEKLWHVVTRGENNNWTMVGGTGNSPANNVAEGHAETCLGSLILYNADGSEHVKLIKMRNPWGHYQYNGPWSSKSDLWTPEFKKQADFGEATDGIFYTPLSLWLAEYENLAIAHVYPWQESKIEGTHSVYEPSDQQHEFVTMTNPMYQDVMIECDQYTNRLWPDVDNKQCNSQHDFPQSYNAYLYAGENNTSNQMTTYPAQIDCSGGSFVLENLAPGEYNVGVWSFDGSDKGHGIWQIRTFGQNVAAPVRHSALK